MLNLGWILDWKNKSHEGHFGANRRNCSVDWMLDIEFMVLFQSVLLYLNRGIIFLGNISW